MSGGFKSSVVATLGVSPPVVTELLSYLISGGERITDLTIIYTSEPDVRASFKLIECAVADRYPRIRVHGRMVDRPDITRTEDAYDFLDFAAGVLRDEVLKHNVQRIHLNLSGGRKGMAIALVILAQFFPISGAYLVVAQDIKAFNESLERIRYEIGELSKSKDMLQYYRSKRELFDPVMYPPRHEYEVIEIPIIPYPSEVLRKIMDIESGEDVFSKDFLNRLKAANLVTITKRGIYPTETFSKILKIMRKVVLG